MKTLIAPTLLTMVLAASMTSCETMNNQTAGTLGGAALGGTLGAIAGNNIDGLGTAGGAAIGAGLGGLVGNRMGAQQDQINDIDSRVNYMTVSVQNSNGSVTPVQLRRVQGDIWAGPRGEQYNGVPSSNQLRGAYGF